MMPDNSLSSQALTDGFAFEGSATTDFLVDYEMGGVALNDPSQGHLVKLWKAEVRNLRVVYLSAPGVPETQLYAGLYQITEISLTFDQNMRPFLAFVERGQAKFLWFDPVPSMQVVTVMASDVISPKGSLDDKRLEALSTSDIILAYVRGTSLYMRLQRDRYLIEYLLTAGVQGRLMQIGMNTNYRMQFIFGIRQTYDEYINSRIVEGDAIESSSELISDNSDSSAEADIWEEK